MKITIKEKFVAWLTLISGLSISAVAVYYSVAGLVSIFSASVIPIIIMGVTLEVSKLIATLWLKQSWNIAPAIIKIYLFIAIIILMGITSMGIFGYLSKAHLDQAVPSSMVVDQVSMIDEKINTLRGNIDASRKALAQMDATVDQTISRSTSESGASRAAALRRTQTKERSILQNEIAQTQLEISKLNEEKAPLKKELRKVEAEVGPIKYIAALIYGDDINDTILEKSVRWVIILIVLIFDPLAVVMLLASQYSFSFFEKHVHSKEPTISEPPIPVETKPEYATIPGYTYSHTYKEPKYDYTYTALHTIPEVEPEVDTLEEVIDEQNIASVTEDTVPASKKKLSKSSLKEAKKRFKNLNPNETIHSVIKKKELGLIDRLPWEIDQDEN